MAPRNKSRVAKSTAGTRRTSRQVSLSVAAATATATASRELRPQQTNSSPSLGSNFAAVGRGILPSQFNSPLPPSRSLGHDVGGVFGNNHFDNDLFKTEYPMGGFSGHELLGNGLDSDDIDADGDEEFDLHPSLASNPNTPSQSFSNTPQTFMSSSQTQTTASVAQAAYPGQVKIESSLCKRLGQDPAMREPTQRRTDQKLNLERRSNVEALLAHVSGQAPARQCKNCHKGHGPWTECIVYEGQMCGSCTNCWYNASGSRCTFHENNHPQPQNVYTPASTSMMGYQPTLPQSSSLPSMPFFSLSQQQPQQIAPPEYGISGWNLEDPTGRMISQAIGDAVSLSRRDRFVARIESAAEELRMRIAEYDDYLRTPEGAAEQAVFDERERRRMMMHNDPYMDGSSQDSL